jgi:two-component system sensor histidine kinase KdpD
VDEHEVRSAIVLPLIVHGAVYGCLGVGSTMPHQFSERHFHIAQAFAERMAQALWNTRLYQLEQDRARAAEHLAALRNELVSTVSHELRTPLTAVLGYAEMLEGHWPRLNDQQRRAYLERIVLAANRQRQLIDDLLRAGSYANEKLTVRCEDLVVLDVAARATELVRASFTQQRIDEGGPPDLVARADPALLEQILVNLLDNAAKYSPEGAPVELAWEQEGDYVAIRVHDRGPGIPEAGREILFSRFGRVPGSRIRAGHVGTGLGLYLGRAQADAMGGALELESTGTSGSTFRLRLPRGGQRTCGSP